MSLINHLFRKAPGVPTVIRCRQGADGTSEGETGGER